MNLESLKSLPPLDLDAIALVRVCGWRWMREKTSGRCALQPPMPAKWGVPHQWEPTSFRDGDEALPVDVIPPAGERFGDWHRCGALMDETGECAERSGMPRPSQSIADAWDLEEAIAKAGLNVQYIRSLRHVCRPDSKSSASEWYWALVHASPLQRTLAAVLATEETR